MDGLAKKEEGLPIKDWVKLTWLKEIHIMERCLMPKESSSLLKLESQE